MGLFDKLRAIFLSASASNDYLNVTIRCKRCGEQIQTRVNLNNDLSFEESTDSIGFFCRKGMMGTGVNHCYEKFELTVCFDEHKKVLSTEILGKGELVSIN